jgi:hypothetical protein
MSAPRTKVTIDRLVLRGVDPHHAQAMAESLKKELARAFAGPGGRERLQRAQDTPILQLGRVPLEAGRAGARKFGINVARAISKGVKR